MAGNKLDFMLDEKYFSPNDCAEALVEKMTRQGHTCTLHARGPTPIIMLDSIRYRMQMSQRGEVSMALLTRE